VATVGMSGTNHVPGAPYRVWPPRGVGAGPPRRSGPARKPQGIGEGARPARYPGGRGPTLGSWLVGKEDTASLLLFDQQGAVRAGLSVLEGGRPSLGFLDTHGQSRMVLTLEPNGSPMMRWLNAQGQVIWSAP
jgi:hypothetical protein